MKSKEKKMPDPWGQRPPPPWEPPPQQEAEPPHPPHTFYDPLVHAPGPIFQPGKPKKPDENKKFRWGLVLILVVIAVILAKLFYDESVPLLSPIIKTLTEIPAVFNESQWNALIWAIVFVVFVTQVRFWVKRNRSDSSHSNEDD